MTSRRSSTCSTAATAPPARSSLTRPTTTCARSWRRSSRRPAHSCRAASDAPYNRLRMSTGGPDLFVICKNCGSEVSPYITECPYCGNRLRKRAPKIDREGRVAERRRRRPPAPALPRLKRGEIPGIRPESHPYATIGLVLAGIVGCLLWRTSLVDLSQLIIIGKPNGHWWKLITAPFVYSNT